MNVRRCRSAGWLDATTLVGMSRNVRFLIIVLPPLTATAFGLTLL